MVRLIGDGHVLIAEFGTEAEGLEYIRKNRYDLQEYYSHYEVVVPGEKTIWKVSDTLINDVEYRKQIKKKRLAAAQAASFSEDDCWGDEEDR